jgi:hypothetical protein
VRLALSACLLAELPSFHWQELLIAASPERTLPIGASPLRIPKEYYRLQLRASRTTIQRGINKVFLGRDLSQFFVIAAASSYHVVGPLLVLFPGLPRAYVYALVPFSSVALYYAVLFLQPDLVPTQVPAPLPAPHASYSLLVSTS